jgi:hypothetical protein
MSEQQFQAEVMDELRQQQENDMETTATYKVLREIDVNKYTEKKGQLTYLSWTWAVDQLLLQDPMAVWEFPEPRVYNETMMVFCNVTALGKTMRMQLPVMDNRNAAIVNPDARKISDATMRCLAKCIACFGIGLYIFAGEDLPQVEFDTTPLVDKIKTATTMSELQEFFTASLSACGKNKEAQAVVIATKDSMKAKLGSKS